MIEQLARASCVAFGQRTLGKVHFGHIEVRPRSISLERSDSALMPGQAGESRHDSNHHGRHDGCANDASTIGHPLPAELLVGQVVCNPPATEDALVDPVADAQMAVVGLDDAGQAETLHRFAGIGGGYVRAAEDAVVQCQHSDLPLLWSNHLLRHKRKVRVGGLSFGAEEQPAADHINQSLIRRSRFGRYRRTESLREVRVPVGPPEDTLQSRLGFAPVAVSVCVLDPGDQRHGLFGSEVIQFDPPADVERRHVGVLDQVGGRRNPKQTEADAPQLRVGVAALGYLTDCAEELVGRERQAPDEIYLVNKHDQRRAIRRKAL